MKIIKQTKEMYFHWCESIKLIEKNIGAKNVLNIYLEEIIKYPENNIKKIFNFLDLKVKQDFINSCKKLIFNKPNSRKETVVWEKDEINTIKSEIDKYSYLKKYKNDIK